MPNISTHDRVKKYAKTSIEHIKSELNTDEFGLSDKQIEKNRDEYGNNYVTKLTRSITWIFTGIIIFHSKGRQHH